MESEESFRHALLHLQLQFWYSQGQKSPYDSAYNSNSDSVAGENQPYEDKRGAMAPASMLMK